MIEVRFFVIAVFGEDRVVVEDHAPLRIALHDGPLAGTPHEIAFRIVLIDIVVAVLGHAALLIEGELQVILRLIAGLFGQFDIFDGVGDGLDVALHAEGADIRGSDDLRALAGRQDGSGQCGNE